GALSERLRRVNSWRSSAVSGRRGSFRWRDIGHLEARGSPHHYTTSHGRRPTSAVNEIVAKRMTKKQQMRWSRATVQPFLDVRTAVLNDTLEDASRHRYSGFRPANDDQVLPAAA